MVLFPIALCASPPFVPHFLSNGVKNLTFLHAELVQVIKGKPINSTLKAGDYFGHEVIVDRQKYSATVVSLQTTTGWKIDRTVLTNSIPVEKLKRNA